MELTEAIQKLIKLIDDKKQFQLEKNIPDFDILPLIQNKIVQEEDGLIKPLSSEEFSKEFYKFYAHKLDFNLSENFSSTINFFKKIKDSYRQKGQVIRGVTEQMNNLLGYLIFLTNQKFSYSFEDYILELDPEKSDKFFYDFSRAFSKELHRLKIPIDALSQIISHLHSKLYTDLILNKLLKGIEDYAFANPKDAKELFWHYFANDEIKNLNTNSVLLSGIYKANRKEGKKYLEKIAKTEGYEIATIGAIAFSTPISSNEGNELLDLVEQLGFKEEHALSKKPLVYVNILMNEALKEDKNLIERCFSGLSYLLEIRDENITNEVLARLEFVNGFENERFHLINSINSDDIGDKQLQIISKMFFSFRKPKLLFDFLKKIIAKKGLFFEIKLFELPISHFLTTNPNQLSINVIKSLIDNRGNVRLLGNRVLRQILNTNESFNFSTDILKLGGVKQYKLWASILNEVPNPKEVFHLLLPLRKSQYPFVVEAFTCKVEDLIFEFSYSVIETIEAIVNLKNPVDEKFYNRVYDVFLKYKQYVDKKLEVNELNPFLTQAILEDRFTKVFNDRMSSRVKNSMDDHSVFLAQMPEIKLAKGGGWKLENQSEVQELSKIGTSFQFPRRYFISPEMFEIEVSIGYSKNWGKFCRQWEPIISSLKSI